MRLIVVVLLIVLGAQPALAQGYAASPWPQSAENRALPRPSWVLVIPARRHADGSLTIWDRDDEWTRAWRVPRVIDGMRVVTLFGDSQDSRSITSAAIDGMQVDEMQVVLDKYGAPALALAVNDGTSVAVAAYVPGWSAGWSATTAGADDTESRENALDVIGALFSGSAAAPQQPTSDPIEILAFRDDDMTGGRDYRVAVRVDEGRIQGVIDQIASVPGGNIVDVQRDADGVVLTVQRYPGAPPLEDDLRTYGLMP